MESKQIKHASGRASSLAAENFNNTESTGFLKQRFVSQCIHKSKYYI